MGFTLKKDKLRRHCQDIDECMNYRGLCKGNLHCTNTVGSYICGCRGGYETIATNCIDIDECQNWDPCPEMASCINTQGNFTCQCYEGYQGDLCADKDECLTDRNDCDSNADCTNSGMSVRSAYP